MSLATEAAWKTSDLSAESVKELPKKSRSGT